MVITESSAATCYGFDQDRKRVIVTVVAQWADDGRIRLIQANEFAESGGSPANDLSWKGRTFARPEINPEYFDSVFRLVTDPKHQPRQQTVQER